jgi:hypothetical protein
MPFFLQPFQKIYQFLYPITSVSSQIIGTSFAVQPLSGCDEAAEKDMKIYLLMMLIGALLTAVHFTSAPEKRPETLPQ